MCAFVWDSAADAVAAIKAATTTPTMEKQRYTKPATTMTKAMIAAAIYTTFKNIRATKSTVSTWTSTAAASSSLSARKLSRVSGPAPTCLCLKNTTFEAQPIVKKHSSRGLIGRGSIKEEERTKWREARKIWKENEREIAQK